MSSPAHLCSQMPCLFNADATELDNYVANMHGFLINNKKIPKKWWSFDVTKLLLQLHLKATNEFGAGQQGASFNENKRHQNKSKFERDQKNQECNLLGNGHWKRKRKRKQLYIAEE